MCRPGLGAFGLRGCTLWERRPLVVQRGLPAVGLSLVRDGSRPAISLTILTGDPVLSQQLQGDGSLGSRGERSDRGRWEMRAGLDHMGPCGITQIIPSL